ncbi:MAG: helix-turn-helix domain-containing protein [Prevotellaceae bacterium]|jgi:transcriptional regulator with XRE-family HTH domain|nr:helix-turn-helix domain-containing protein [Prevotellaceae bacterium]
MAVGFKMSKLIEDRDVRKIELSKHLGVARNTLDDYLSEKTYMTSDKIEKVAKFFNVPVGYFFDESPQATINKELTTEDRLLSIIESQQRTIENLTNK